MWSRRRRRVVWPCMLREGERRRGKGEEGRREGEDKKRIKIKKRRPQAQQRRRKGSTRRSGMMHWHRFLFPFSFRLPWVINIQGLTSFALFPSSKNCLSLLPSLPPSKPYTCHFEKKSFPLSSHTTNAGKSTTSIFQIASIPSSGYSNTSTFLMLFCAKIAAGPPIDPK